MIMGVLAILRKIFVAKGAHLSLIPQHPNILTIYGALAQLVERNNGIVEVNGSTPLRSI